MKRTIVVLMLIVGACWNGVAGEGLKLGASVGFAKNAFDRPNKLGMSFLGSLSYAAFEDLELNLTSGYMTWGYDTWTERNTTVVPIAIGVKYFFLHFSGVRPYLAGDLSYNFGRYNYTVQFSDDHVVSGTQDISEIGSALGLGVLIPVGDRVSLDVGSMGHMTARSNATYNIRLMAGIQVNL
jgi:hypothetical protein